MVTPRFNRACQGHTPILFVYLVLAPKLVKSLEVGQVHSYIS